MIEKKFIYDPGIGFDAVKVQLQLLDIDEEQLDAAINGNSDNVRAMKGVNPQKCLYVNGRPLQYASVIIMLSPYAKIRMQKSNLVGKADIYILEMKVVPDPQELGNINNCDCAKLKDRINSILRGVENEYGVVFSRKNVNLVAAEINKNINAECSKTVQLTYDYIARLVAPVRNMLDERHFVNAIFSVPLYASDFEKIQKGYRKDNGREFEVIPKQ